MALSYPSGATPSQPLSPSLCHHHTTLLFSSVALILSPQMILLIGFHGYAPHQHHHTHTHTPIRMPAPKSSTGLAPSVQSSAWHAVSPRDIFLGGSSELGGGPGLSQEVPTPFPAGSARSEPGLRLCGQGSEFPGLWWGPASRPTPSRGCQGDHCHNIPWHSEGPADRGENDLTRSRLK